MALVPSTLISSDNCVVLGVVLEGTLTSFASRDIFDFADRGGPYICHIGERASVARNSCAVQTVIEGGDCTLHGNSPTV